MNKKVSKIKTKWDSLSSGVQNLAKLISAVVVIGGALTGIGGWMVNQFHEVVNDELAPIQQQLETYQKRVETNERDNLMATTRLELTTLIFHYPNKVDSIVKVASFYFQELHGDSYIHVLYNDWCEDHAPDKCSVAVLE